MVTFCLDDRQCISGTSVALTLTGIWGRPKLVFLVFIDFISDDSQDTPQVHSEPIRPELPRFDEAVHDPEKSQQIY
jgi:hypothetical protein